VVVVVLVVEVHQEVEVDHEVEQVVVVVQEVGGFPGVSQAHEMLDTHR
jgi:hypothetical protein